MHWIPTYTIMHLLWMDLQWKLCSPGSSTNIPGSHETWRQRLFSQAVSPAYSQPPYFSADINRILIIGKDYYCWDSNLEMIPGHACLMQQLIYLQLRQECIMYSLTAIHSRMPCTQNWTCSLTSLSSNYAEEIFSPIDMCKFQWYHETHGFALPITVIGLWITLYSTTQPSLWLSGTLVKLSVSFLISSFIFFKWCPILQIVILGWYGIICFKAAFFPTITFCLKLIL